MTIHNKELIYLSMSDPTIMNMMESFAPFDAQDSVITLSNMLYDQFEKGKLPQNIHVSLHPDINVIVFGEVSEFETELIRQSAMNLI